MAVPPRRPQAETIHQPAWDHGQPPPVKVSTEWIENPKAKGYTGCNACWREGHGHEEGA